MTATAELTVSNLSAGYGARMVLSGLSLAPLLPGEIVALVGPNGAGKSTFLRVLAGLLAGRGSIRFEGRDLLTLPLAARAAEIGFMPQTLPQRVGLTVLEGMIAALRASPLSNGSRSGRHAPERAMLVLERVGIAPLANEPLDHLSGGQRQLASLAQAIVREPKVLLLDEPTSALDLRHQAIVSALVREFASDGHIVIIVVHDLSLAARWADHVVVMDRGEVHTAGQPVDAITPAVLAAVYGVDARVERCSRGTLQILVDGVAKS